MRPDAFGIETEAAGEDFVELNGHPFQSQQATDGTVVAAFFNASQVPAITELTFDADPIAWLNVTPARERSGKSNLCGAASSHAMEFKPTAANRLIVENERRPMWGRTVMQDTAEEGHLVCSTLRGQRPVECRRAMVVMGARFWEQLEAAWQAVAWRYSGPKWMMGSAARI
ncbi:MAG: hypothetical protein KDA58_02130 [Planctomycetaceae bacterium]|nr:hypothetical protein [Planctomycetaceae bacterium]